MKINDAISGVLLLVLALTVLFNISSYPPIPGQNIGPAAFPGLLAGLLVVCSLGLIWRGLRPGNRGDWVVIGAWFRSHYHRRNFLLTNAGLLFYILASDALGFIPTSVLLLAMLFWALRVRLARILPLAVGVTLLIHTIFYKGLRVPLPWGILLPMQW